MTEGVPGQPIDSIPATPLGRALRHLEIGILGVLFLALVVLGLAQYSIKMNIYPGFQEKQTQTTRNG